MTDAPYASQQVPSHPSEQPVTILVTGFGPFLDRVPINSSWSIASTLPALLPYTPSSPTPVHIHVHHTAIRVNYRIVLDLVPKLLPPKSPLRPTPSIILHIGLAAGQSYYAIERGACGRGYDKIPDVDGDRFTDDDAEEHFPASKFPTRLETSFDLDHVLVRWKRFLHDRSGSHDPSQPGDVPDVRISHDAGNFLCGFTYFNSLACHHARKEDERPVVFLHVPVLGDSEEKMREGREVTIALIRALVESGRERGVVRGVERLGINEDCDAAVLDNNFA